MTPRVIVSSMLESVIYAVYLKFSTRAGVLLSDRAHAQHVPKEKKKKEIQYRLIF